jgi:Cytochrome P450
MFVPFGQGPRVCIGQHFSLIEARVVLAMLLLRFDFTLQRPYHMEWENKIIPLQPQGGVPVTITARNGLVDNPSNLEGQAVNGVHQHASNAEKRTNGVNRNV